MDVKIIADSVSDTGKRLTTFQLKYPRFIHSEFMTHRVFSRNASSSRAIPVSKMIEQVRSDPAMPIHWGKNQPGMQASEEIQHVMAAKDQWLRAAKNAADVAEEMNQLGLHKQVVNRTLESFQWIHVVVTSTEWDNFFELRAHEDAQPEIHELAIRMRDVMNNSHPTLLESGEWHLPYIEEEELSYCLRNSPTVSEGWELMLKVSAARCCRVSYLKHDGQKASIEEELKLCDRLVGSVPLHASPFEHQASPDIIIPDSRSKMAHWSAKHLHGNFMGWVQYRKVIEQQMYNKGDQ